MWHPLSTWTFYQPSGAGSGWARIRRPRSEKEIRLEREAWGILPKEIKEVIENVAEQQIRENLTQQQAVAELRKELVLQGLVAEESRKQREYALLLRAEIQRILEDEDAAAIIILTLNG